MDKIALAKAAYSIGKEVFDYLRDDQVRSYALVAPTSVTIEGPGVGIGNFTDGVYSIVSPNPDKVVLSCIPFPASAKYWNGPDVIPDDWNDGSLQMSFHHDMIWGRAKAIAAATGLTEGEVLEWGNGIGVAVWNAYAPKDAKAVKPKSYVFYNICNWFKKPYRKIKSWFRVVVVVVGLSVAMGHSGCQKPPDWRATAGDPIIHELDSHVQTNAITRPLQP